MVLMRYAHLPAATTSQQSAAARMCFVAGRRLHPAEHIGVNEQLSLEFALFPSLAKFCSTFGGKADIGRPFPLRRGNRCCGHCNPSLPTARR
jgi:hypothetical protein